MKVIISGGGIAGLTLGLTAKKAGHIPIIIQQRSAVDQPSFGGGIGLWPPSQMVMERLGILKQLQQNGMYMPSACYYNSRGHVLGHPSLDFSKKFPVICLQRQQLSKSLSKQCKLQGVQIKTSTSLQNTVSTPEGVIVTLSNGQSLKANILIGADGIGSKVRNIIRKQGGHPEILPYHCQYAYFRSVVNIDQDQDKNPQWHKHAFQSWGQGKRFGYIPLKYPKTFWFVAIPIGQKNLQKCIGSHICSEQQKQWIKQQFEKWKAPIKIKKLIQLTPAGTILRTDICKVKDVTSFDWYSKNKNIIILGDSANATAPNLAQGAGLAIESAWDLVSMVNFSNYKGLQQYIAKRKRRALTVQQMADLVAKTGQLKSSKSRARDFVMKNSTSMFRSLQQLIFQQVVSYSVGGNSSKLYWMPPNIPSNRFHKNIIAQNSMLGRVIGKQQYKTLPLKTKIFRSSYVASGSGKVSVSTIFGASLLGLPTNMVNSPFEAYCETVFNSDGTQNQIWTRVFGSGQPGAAKYATTHRQTPNLWLANTGTILTQTLGIGPDILRFGYLPQISNNTILYKSLGVWFRNYKIAIPKFLLPTSQWEQKQTDNGWNFQGRIKLPFILGSFNIMTYSGSFSPEICSKQVAPKNKKVVIAGGTGMIGLRVAKSFYLSGWDVQFLTRNNLNCQIAPYVKMHEWNPQNDNQSDQIQKLRKIFEGAQLVINLSGQNPGSGFWTQKKKIKILTSRLKSIKLIGNALKKIKQSPTIFLQASAAGIYGNRNQQILADDNQPGKQTAFRVQTCKQIQKLTREINAEAGIIRIGHVLCSQGGLFPSLELASKMRASRFGKGNQYVPWIHIQDLADSIVHIGSNFQHFRGKTVNAASPNSITCQTLLSKIATMRRRRACIIPVPQVILRLVLGQVSSVIFDSQRMHPKLLLQSKFQFKYSDIQKALASRQCL